MSFQKSWTGSVNNAMNVASLQLLAANAMMNLIKQYVAAGWSVAGSSNGGKATVNSVGAGTNFVISNISGSTWQLKDNSGNNLFTADQVGSNLVLASFTNGGNNHTFVITAYTNSSTIQYAAGAFTPVAETGPGAATWSVQAAAGIDAVDRLTAGVQNFVWAAGGVAHWWVILKSPSGLIPSASLFYKLFAGSTGAANQHLVNAGHASAAYTAGSTTADPTAPTNARAFTNKQIVNSTNANSNWHSTYSSIGDIVYGVSKNTTGYIAFVSMVATATLYNDTGGYDYDAIMVEAFTDSSPGALQHANLNVSTHITCFYRDGTVLPSGSGGMIGWHTAGGIWIGGNITNANGTSNVSNLTLDFPIALYSYGTNTQSYKGQLTDFAWAPTGPSGTALIGKSDPNVVATVNSMCWGEMFVPMPNVTADLAL